MKTPPSPCGLLAAAFCLASFLPSPGRAQPSQSIRLEIRIPHPQVAVGAPIPATVRILPGSPSAREVVVRGGVDPVRIIVARARTTLPDLASDALSRELPLLRRMRVRPAPGGGLEFDTDISYWAKLDRPGRHDVIVEYGEHGQGEDASLPPVRSPGLPLHLNPRVPGSDGARAAELRSRLSRQEGLARIETVRALGSLRSRAAMELLIDELYSEQESSRWAASALSLVPDRDGVLAAARRALASRGLSGPLTDVLLRGGDPAGGLIEVARAAAENEDPRLRRRGIEALAAVLRSDPRQSDVTERLLRAAREMEPRIRQAALFGLEASSDARVEERLREGARDPVASVRSVAVRALKVRRAAGVLGELFGQDRTDSMDVARALAALGEPAATRLLVSTLSGRSTTLRLAAARALWEVGNRSGRGVLILGLRSRDDELRAELVDWLTLVNDRAESAAGVPALALAWSRWLEQVR